jgi:hypothetical protein
MARGERSESFRVGVQEGIGGNHEPANSLLDES